jgi:hypothetical protein
MQQGLEIFMINIYIFLCYKQSTNVQHQDQDQILKIYKPVILKRIQP